jgi:hypothetical protein
MHYNDGWTLTDWISVPVLSVVTRQSVLQVFGGYL